VLHRDLADVRLHQRDAAAGSQHHSFSPVSPSLSDSLLGDVFTLSRPAAVLAASLGPLATRFVMRALPLAPTTVPIIPRPRAPPQLTGPLRTRPRSQIPALNLLSAEGRISDSAGRTENAASGKAA
jgi:hypothetical protein